VSCAEDDRPAGTTAGRPVVLEFVIRPAGDAAEPSVNAEPPATLRYRDAQ
jgi:hypothetical protein